MLIDTQILSAAEMQQVRPSSNTIVVSILDRSEEIFRPELKGFRDTLTLCFEDVSEEAWGDEPGSWPDAPDRFDHARFTTGVGERIPTLEDARRIVEFLLQHHRSEERIHLVVHCYAGISRSAAVGLWVARRLYVPIIDGGTKSCDGANRRLLRLLDKASAWHDAPALI